MKRTEQPGLSVTEYARENNLTTDWIYRLARLGRIDHVRIYGRIFITEPSRKGAQK